MALVATFIILIHVAAAVILSWLYFRRYAMTRPPIGVFNLGDIAVMIGAVILVPFLYLLLPLWVLASLLALASVSIPLLYLGAGSAFCLGNLAGDNPPGWR